MTSITSLSDEQLAIVKSTAPAIRENSVEISERLYERLFENHPETKAFFVNTPAGQAERLAAALVAYTKSVDNLSALSGAVQTIAKKHVAAGVQPAHYDIVGTELLGAVVDVLGAIPDHVIDAWGAAYQVLADIFIEAEAQLATEAA